MPLNLALHVTMKIHVIALLFLFSALSHSGEWYEISGEVGPKIDSTVVEKDLWIYLKGKAKHEFKPKNTYRFQYKHLSKSKIFINAFCSHESENGSKMGAFPQPDPNTLREEIYEVFDGGACYFSLQYDTKTGSFSKLSVNGVR